MTSNISQLMGFPPLPTRHLTLRKLRWLARSGRDDELYRLIIRQRDTDDEWWRKMRGISLRIIVYATFVASVTMALSVIVGCAFLLYCGGLCLQRRREESERKGRWRLATTNAFIVQVSARVRRGELTDAEAFQQVAVYEIPEPPK